MSEEEWRPVVGWEGIYAISDTGRVRSLARTVVGLRRVYRVKERILRPAYGNGYAALALCRNGQRTYNVHSLVWEAFRRKPPKGIVINHINGDRSDPRLLNLEECTHAENITHSRYVLGKDVAGTANNARLTQGQVDDIRARIARGERQVDIARLYGVSPGLVCDIKKGRCWKVSGGFTERIQLPPSSRGAFSCSRTTA